MMQRLRGRLLRRLVWRGVLWKVGLAGRVPRSEAAVANTLGEEDLLAVVVVWLFAEDVFKGFGLALSVRGLRCLW